MTLNALVNGGLAILMVVVYELSWQGRAYSLLISAILMAVIAILMNIKEKDVELSSFKFTNQAGTIYSLGTALIPSAIGGWAIAMTDRIFLTGITSLEIVGIYAVGVMIAQIVDIFFIVLARACHPMLAKYGDSEDPSTKIIIVQVFIYLYLYQF